MKLKKYLFLAHIIFAQNFIISMYEKKSTFLDQQMEIGQEPPYFVITKKNPNNDDIIQSFNEEKLKKSLHPICENFLFNISNLFYNCRFSFNDHFSEKYYKYKIKNFPSHYKNSIPIYFTPLGLNIIFSILNNQTIEKFLDNDVNNNIENFLQKHYSNDKNQLDYKIAMFKFLINNQSDIEKDIKNIDPLGKCNAKIANSVNTRNFIPLYEENLKFFFNIMDIIKKNKKQCKISFSELYVMFKPFLKNNECDEIKKLPYSVGHIECTKKSFYKKITKYFKEHLLLKKQQEVFIIINLLIKQTQCLDDHFNITQYRKLCSIEDVHNL